ncbi:MAG: rRNA pseudouridine synthase [Prevotella sp.]|nr:rRNA pseudouridine synthase [Prevotella sp.]
MVKDFEERQQELSEERTGQGREGYEPVRNYRRDYRPDSRPPRPRINKQSTSYGKGYSRRDDEGFRPEGFGAGLQQPQRPFRPRYGGNDEYRAPRNQGYRPRYGSDSSERPYQQRPYQPRPYGDRQERGGDFQQRPYGGSRPYGRQQYGDYQRQDGFRPRQSNYRPRTADYNPHAKYSMKKRIEYKEEHIDPNAPVRLNKYLANAGVCSRREADDFILAGVVTVNGEVVKELGTKVMRSDSVKFHDQPVTMEKKVYVLLNKPKDTVTTSDDPQNRKTVMELVKDACPERIYPVGRLDRNTTGVLLLTNDGELASKLTHPRFLKKKVYHVYLDKNVTAHDLRQIAEGITLEDGEIKADSVEYAHETDKSQVGIEIHSGRNRIVRRIFEHLGYRVIKLDRVQFAGLTKKNVRRGDWRFLTEKEVEMLRMGAFE